MTPENKTRRAFLQTTALAFPAVIGLSAKVNAQTANEGKLGLVLCGLGGFSEKTIAPEIASSKEVYFAGAVTGDAEKGRKWAKKYGFPEKHIYSYADMPKMADNKEIAIVHVVTPNGIHAENTIAAAKAGKHVMCEKPMATSSEQCEAMIAAAKENNVMLGVNYRLHYEPHHIEMIRLVRENVFGPAKSMNTEFSWNRRDSKPWLLDKKLAGGGAAFDTGVYCIQAGCYIAGETPTHITAVPTTTRDVYPKDIEETLSWIAEYPSGLVQHARASYCYQRHELIVNSEKGTFSSTGQTFGQSVNGTPNPKSITLPNGKEWKTDQTLQLAVLYDEFVAGIKGEREFKCNGEMGLRDIRILEAAYRSASQGCTRVEVHA